MPAYYCLVLSHLLNILPPFTSISKNDCKIARGPSRLEPVGALYRDGFSRQMCNQSVAEALLTQCSWLACAFPRLARLPCIGFASLIVIGSFVNE